MNEAALSDVSPRRYKAPWSWFVIDGTVQRKPYFTVGIGLALLKYAIEFGVVYFYSNELFSPMDFVNPWLNTKAPFLQGSPGLGIVWLVFTIPFVWVAITMSVRRAADIGISPWVGLLTLIPLVNVVVMFVLATIPTNYFAESESAKKARLESDRAMAEAFRAPVTDITLRKTTASEISRVPIGKRLLIAILAGCGTQVATGAISVWLLQTYGFILFFSSPMVAGAVSGFVYSGGQPRSAPQITGMSFLMNVLSFATMLFVGLDGAICLIIAYPILFPLSLLGSFLGASLATANLRPGRDERPGMVGTMLILPLCLFVEPFDNEKPIHAVTTVVEIAAPPEVVWEQVVAFPDITEEMDWFFRMGIAAPLRARIDGKGVGAVRHCEFTTGNFVEPIRVWDPPERLAFDVTSQPYPMSEWTPIPHLHPPHLDDGIKSLRGEFRLERTASGGTRLSGTTWYQLNVRPRLYWKCWADPVLHAIHRRVLRHIGNVAESSEIAE